MGCCHSLEERLVNQQQTHGRSQSVPSTQLNAAVVKEEEDDDDDDGKEERDREYATGSLGQSGDVPSRTACISAATEYATLVSVKSAQDHLTDRREQTQVGLAPMHIQPRVDFAISHRELLGRCWDARGSERLSNCILRAATPRWRGAITNYSFGRTPTQRESSGSPTVLLPSPKVLTVPLLSSFDGLSRRLIRGNCAQQRCSHWVSLVQPVQPTAIRPKGSMDVIWKRSEGACSAANNSCDRLMSAPMSHDSVDDVTMQKQRHALGCSFAGAKDVFAFRLAEEESMEETSFLRKRGMKVGFGVQVHRWDRAEFVALNIHSLAAAVAQTQLMSVESSSMASAISVSSSYAQRDGIQSGHAGGTTIQVPTLLTDNFLSNTSRSSSPSRAGCMEESTRFPEKSVLCHCLTLPARRLQMMQGGHAPLTPFSLSSPVLFPTSTQNGSPVVTDTCAGFSGAPAPQSPLVHHKTAAQVEKNRSKKAVHSARHEGVATGRTEDLSKHFDEGIEKKPPPIQVSTTSFSDCASTTASAPALVSVIVSSFDVSIDPSQWREGRYHRTPVNCADTRPSVRQQYGEGVVTRVMYGGVCVVECSSPAAVHELKSMLSAARWNTAAARTTTATTKRRSKALVTSVKKTLRKNDKMKDGVSGSLAGSDPAFSGAPASPSERMPSALYRVVCSVGGMEIGAETHTRQWGRFPSLDSINTTVAPSELTSWVGLKAMTKIVHSWALHLLCNVDFTEPIALYLQKFAGIIPTLRLTCLEGNQLHHIKTSPNDDDRGNDSDDDDDDKEEETEERDCGDDDDDGGQRSEVEQSFLNAVGKFDKTFDLGDESLCIPHRSLAHSDATSTFATGFPLPIVLHTGRALTHILDDDDQLMSVSTSGSRSKTNSTAYSNSVNKLRKRAPSLWQLQQSRSGLLPKLIHGRRSASVRQESFMHSSGFALAGRRGVGSKKMQESTFSTSCRTKGEWRSVRLASLDQSFLIPSPAEKNNREEEEEEEKEKETLWDHAMLEVKALENELQDVLDARHEADEMLAQVNITLQNLQRALLPNTSIGAIEPLYTYVHTIVEMPIELPERCIHFDGPDWFPCLAAVLTSSRLSPHAVQISYPLRIMSLPKLGMLAGVLFHEDVMPRLRSLTICCRNFCGATPPNRGSLTTAKQKSFPSSSTLYEGGYNWRENEMSSLELPWMGGCHQGPPFFVTPEQARGIFHALTNAVLSNVRQSRFVLRLKDFPEDPVAIPRTGIQRLIYTVIDTSTGGGGGGSRNSNRAKGPFKGRSMQLEGGSLHSMVDSPECGSSGGGDEIRNVWNNAECMPYCMFLRHREWTAPHRASHFRRVTGDDEAAGSGNAAGAQWVYGLPSHHLEVAVLRHAEKGILAKAPYIFNEMQALTKAHAASGANDKGGDKKERFTRDIILTR